VDCIAADLRQEFPGISGFSRQNMWKMRGFYLAWTRDAQDLSQAVSDLEGNPNLSQLVREIDGQNLPQPVGQIPWGHNGELIFKLKDPLQRLWYAKQTIAHGWSRAVLIHQIESDAYGRQGKALTNFKSTLPAPQSDLAQDLLKDPYAFDFLALGPDISERQLEQALIDRLKDFLIELGTGFAFIGRQYPLEVGGQDYYLDLLFYHVNLGCYIVIDLKVEAFKPEFAGKMNFYLAAVDTQLEHAGDNPPIGLMLCKEHNKIIVEYALQDTTKPMGVATYSLLPKELKDKLPTAKQLRGAIEGKVKLGGNLIIEVVRAEDKGQER
jgi:predicted nuclease of restriction endonuclease-like (RecB) superfamily